MQKLIFKEKLAELGMPQKELARRMGIHDSVLCRTLRQTEKGLSAKFLLDVANIFCMDVKEFFSSREVPHSSTFQDALISYPGGKSQELPILTKLFPDEYDNFYDPFCGGGSVFLNAKPSNLYYINDLSVDLINLYNCIAQQNELFLRTLDDFESHWQGYTESWLNDIDVLYNSIPETLQFDKCILEKVAKKKFPFRNESQVKGVLFHYYRGLFNNADSLDISIPIKAVLFFIMRLFSFSGLIRYNKKGDYNSSYGASYNQKSIKTYLDNYQSLAVQNIFNRTIIENMDFLEFLKKHEPDENDFVFLDSPYDSSFSDYHNSSFTHDHHERLARWTINHCKSKFMVVINNTPFISGLYENRGFNIRYYNKSFKVNFRNRNKKEAEIMVITNY